MLDNVARLSVDDTVQDSLNIMPATKDSSNNPLMITNIEKPASKNATASATPTDATTDADQEETVACVQQQKQEGGEAAPNSATSSTSLQKAKGWKRRTREELEVQSGTNSEPAPPTNGTAHASGCVRPRDKPDQLVLGIEPTPKRFILAVPPLSDCFGREGLRKLIEAELEDPQEEETSNKATEDQITGKDGGTEATGPGAAGFLSDAYVGARQEP